MSAIVRLLIDLCIELFGGLSKFFTIHFFKQLSIFGLVVGGLFLFLFLLSKRD